MRSRTLGARRSRTGRVKVTYNALMEDVRLLPIGPELAEALRAGSEPLRKRYGARVAAEDLPTVRDVVEQTLLMPDYDDAGGWGGYLAVDRTSDLVVGSCAFKGPPTEDGTVEIAYYTFGPYEGQGHAKRWHGRSSLRRFRRPSCGASSPTRCPRTTRRLPSCGAWGWSSWARLTIPSMARSGVGGSNPGKRPAEDRRTRRRGANRHYSPNLVGGASRNVERKGS